MNQRLILIISISLVVSISLFACTTSKGGEEAVAVKEIYRNLRTTEMHLRRPQGDPLG
jgi:hypothetical protein